MDKYYLYLFFILQLINVILSTIKSIATIKGTRKSAALMNGIYYGYYTFVIKAISTWEFTHFFGLEINKEYTVWFAAGVTLITNVIGVWFSLYILAKLRDRNKKDELWLCKTTIKVAEYQKLVDTLHAENMKFSTPVIDWSERKAADIYLYSKEDTRKIKKIFKNFDTIKYCVIETKEITL